MLTRNSTKNTAIHRIIGSPNDMTAALLSSGTLTEIAGQPVEQLARQFGTPVYVYDAAKIVERIERSAQRSTWFALPRRRARIIGDSRPGAPARRDRRLRERRRNSIGRWRPASSRGRLASARDCLHGRHLRSRGARARREARHSRQLRLARHDRPVRRGASPASNRRDVPGSRCGSIRASVTDTARRSTRAASNRSTASGTSSSKTASSGRRNHKLSITGLHMHIGSGTDLEHLSQVCGAMEKAALTVGSSILSISAGGGLPVPYREGQEVCRHRSRTSSCGTRRGTGWRLQFGHEISLEIEPGRYLVAESGFLISEIRAMKTAGENTFYLLDAGFNNLARPILYGAYHPMAICPASGKASEPRRIARPCATSSSAARLCESGDIFTQEEGGFVSQRSLARGTGRRLSRHRVCRRVRLRHGQQLQLEAPCGRSAYRERQAASRSPTADAGRSHRTRDYPSLGVSIHWMSAADRWQTRLEIGLPG